MDEFQFEDERRRQRMRMGLISFGIVLATVALAVGTVAVVSAGKKRVAATSVDMLTAQPTASRANEGIPQGRQQNPDSERTYSPQRKAKPPQPLEQGAATVPSGVMEWSHKELVNHLAQRGVALVTTAYTRSAPLPAVLAARTDESLEFGRRYMDDRNAGFLTAPRKSGRVVIEKHQSAQAAKDQAGTLGESAFSFGPFLFWGDPDFLPQIQAALR